MPRTLAVLMAAAEDVSSKEDGELSTIGLAEDDGNEMYDAFGATTLVEGDDALNQDEELTGDLFELFAECPGASGEG